MKAAEFQKIIKDIEAQKQECETALYEYNTHNMDISNMSVASINRMIGDCRECQSRMDKFVKEDIYHIIGMADLNAAQMSLFIKATKDLMTCRSYIKTFATMNTIPISKVGTKSNYTLSSGIKLIKRNTK